MNAEAFAPLMFGGLVVTLLIGFPVAFSLSALGLLCGLIAIEMGLFPAAFMGNLPLNVLGILSNDLLLAIPFFTLMGAVLEKCGLAEDMLDSMGQLFGPVRGGLAYAVIGVSTDVRYFLWTILAALLAITIGFSDLRLAWQANPTRRRTAVLALGMVVAIGLLSRILGVSTL